MGIWGTYMVANSKKKVQRKKSLARRSFAGKLKKSADNQEHFVLAEQVQNLSRTGLEKSKPGQRQSLFQEQSIETEVLQALGAAKVSETLETKKTSSQKNSSKKTEKQSQKKQKASDLENLLDAEDIDEESSEGDLPSSSHLTLLQELLDYSALAEEFHFEQLHYASMDSEYLPTAAAEHDAKYKEWEEAAEYVMEESETMDEVEAQDTVQEVIYEAVLGGENLSFDKRRRLDNWIKFNPTLFALYKQTSAIRSDNVNYGM